jgi:FimV-like protein
LKVNEPVIQVVVEVVWASGRMLREYTLFLDPPTFESAAPPVPLKQAPLPASVEAPKADIITTPPAAIERTREPEAQEPAPDQKQPVDSESTGPTEERKTEQFEDQYTVDEGAVHGPVARGETLWGIARDFTRGTSYSINQAMLAMQRKNPEAFIRGNINSLKRGAILRLPSFSEMGELTSREAMLEAMRQEQEHRSGSAIAIPDVTTPTVADSGGYQETVTEQIPEPDLKEDAGHLELVPPAEEEAQDSAVADLLPEESESTESIREELSRTEEELLNAKQENTYLTQRIEELEAEVAAKTEKPAGVEDSDLAQLESELEQKRLAGQPEADIAITPGGEKQAWYAGNTGWIAGIAVVLIALIVWALRRRGGATIVAEHVETVEPVKAEPEVEPIPEAEPQLQPEQQPEPVPQPEPAPEPEPEPEPKAQLEPEPETAEEPVRGFESSDEDPQNDDPEIKLDLARAYLSLGDKEASKSMLDEVLKSGNEAQQAEARQMLEEL